MQYLQLYPSIIFAKRYVLRGRDVSEQHARYVQLFTSSLRLLPIHHPLHMIATRCQSMPHCSYISSIQHLRQSTNKQIRQAVLDRFYDQWYAAQDSTALVPTPHSLFPFYNNLTTSIDLTLPLYLRSLSPRDASTFARLRFNRSRLNQSLHKRKRSATDKCPSCPQSIETVEHVLLHCPHYARIRLDCTRMLQLTTGLSLSLPIALGSFPMHVGKRLSAIAISIISVFIRNVRVLRRM